MDDIRKYSKVLEDSVEKVRARVDEAKERAKERVEEFADEARSRGEEAWKDGQKFVQKHPIESIGVALLAGALFGLLISRRRD